MKLEQILKKEIFKSYLYCSMLEDNEEKYEEKYREDGYASIEDIAIDIVDDNTEYLLDSYSDLEQDEETLKEIICTLLIDGFDSDEVECNVLEGSRYNGLSIRERNPFLQ